MSWFLSSSPYCMPTRGQAVLYTGDRPTARDLHLSPNKGPVHWWGGGRGIGKKYTDWLSVLQKTNLLTRKLRSKELVVKRITEKEKCVEGRGGRKRDGESAAATGARGLARKDRQQGTPTEKRGRTTRSLEVRTEHSGNHRGPTVRVDTASDATRFLPHRTFALAGNPAFMTGSDLSFPSTF